MTFLGKIKQMMKILRIETKMILRRYNLDLLDTIFVA
jgi:predicted nuclease of restriction endonuclease-like RecB superfamily